MACFHPLSGYRVRGGQIKFCRPGEWYKDMLKVSCGQCGGCRAERARQWGIRGMHELAMTSDQAPVLPQPIGSFITLTYAKEHLPINGQLSKRAWQLFAKSLRHRIGPFRFLMCGEYGSGKYSERPHYHAAIFGEDFQRPDRDDDRTYLKANKQGHRLFTSPILGEVWPWGHHSIGGISFDSCCYIASYITKKVNGKNAKGHYTRINKETGEVFDQVPEFALMSRRRADGEPGPGGLGYSWIEKYHPEVYPADEVLVNGQTSLPPDYYDRWYEKHHPDKWEEVKSKRKQNGIKYEADNTPARLAVKKKVFQARYAQYKSK